MPKHPKPLKTPALTQAERKNQVTGPTNILQEINEEITIALGDGSNASELKRLLAKSKKIALPKDMLRVHDHLNHVFTLYDKQKQKFDKNTAKLQTAISAMETKADLERPVSAPLARSPRIRTPKPRPATAPNVLAPSSIQAGEEGFTFSVVDSSPSSTEDAMRCDAAVVVADTVSHVGAEALPSTTGSAAVEDTRSGTPVVAVDTLSHAVVEPLPSATVGAAVEDTRSGTPAVAVDTLSHSVVEPLPRATVGAVVENTAQNEIPVPAVDTAPVQSSLVPAAITKMVNAIYGLSNHEGGLPSAFGSDSSAAANPDLRHDDTPYPTFTAIDEGQREKQMSPKRPSPPYLETVATGKLASPHTPSPKGQQKARYQISSSQSEKIANIRGATQNLKSLNRDIVVALSTITSSQKALTKLKELQDKVQQVPLLDDRLQGFFDYLKPAYVEYNTEKKLFDTNKVQLQQTISDLETKIALKRSASTHPPKAALSSALPPSEKMLVPSPMVVALTDRDSSGNAATPTRASVASEPFEAPLPLSRTNDTPAQIERADKKQVLASSKTSEVKGVLPERFDSSDDAYTAQKKLLLTHVSYDDSDLEKHILALVAELDRNTFSLKDTQRIQVLEKTCDLLNSKITPKAYDDFAKTMPGTPSVARKILGSIMLLLSAAAAAFFAVTLPALPIVAATNLAQPAALALSTGVLGCGGLSFFSRKGLSQVMKQVAGAQAHEVEQQEKRASAMLHGG